MRGNRQAELTRGIQARRRARGTQLSIRFAEQHGLKCAKLLREGLGVGPWLGLVGGMPERRRSVVLEHAAQEAQIAARFAIRALGVC